MKEPLAFSHPSLAVKILGGLVLAGVGAVTGYGLATAIQDRGMSWPDSLALAMAVALIAIATLSAGAMVLRPTTAPKGCGVLQVVVFLLAGAMFLAPMYAPAMASPNMVFGGLVLLLAVQTAANVLLWRRADEMLRRIMTETATLAFWVLQSALFLYAAAERLGLVEGVPAWGMLGVLMSVYLVASIIAAARRGVH